MKEPQVFGSVFAEAARVLVHTLDDRGTVLRAILHV